VLAERGKIARHLRKRRAHGALNYLDVVAEPRKLPPPDPDPSCHGATPGGDGVVSGAKRTEGEGFIVLKHQRLDLSLGRLRLGLGVLQLLLPVGVDPPLGVQRCLESHHRGLLLSPELPLQVVNAGVTAGQNTGGEDMA
jgi:hypothetical protein